MLGSYAVECLATGGVAHLGRKDHDDTVEIARPLQVGRVDQLAPHWRVPALSGAAAQLGKALIGPEPLLRSEVLILQVVLFAVAHLPIACHEELSRNDTVIRHAAAGLGLLWNIDAAIGGISRPVGRVDAMPGVAGQE